MLVLMLYVYDIERKIINLYYSCIGDQTSSRSLHRTRQSLGIIATIIVFPLGRRPSEKIRALIMCGEIYEPSDLVCKLWLQ